MQDNNMCIGNSNNIEFELLILDYDTPNTLAVQIVHPTRVDDKVRETNFRV